jgi:hypothetical protein
MPSDVPQQPETPQPWSRYQRVKAILNQAQGQITPSYQGYGRFWELPLNEFLAISLYGVRLIAPVTGGTSPPSAAAAGSCCHGPSTSATSSGATGWSGRGAASGLILGLRGQCLFDGTQFPQLPWDGHPVSASDIQFIQAHRPMEVNILTGNPNNPYTSGQFSPTPQNHTGDFQMVTEWANLGFVLRNPAAVSGASDPEFVDVPSGNSNDLPKPPPPATSPPTK